MGGASTHNKPYRFVWGNIRTLFSLHILLSSARSHRPTGLPSLARNIKSANKASLYSRSLIEASLDPLVTISPEGRITDVNEATVQATGIAREALIGTDFSSYFTEPGKAEEGYRRVFAEGFVTDYPLTIQHASGKQTPVLYNASVYRDDRGEVLGVFAAARDISERKASEEKERKALRALRTITAAGRSLVHISDEKTLLQETCDICIQEGGYRFAWVGYAEALGVKRVRPVAFAGVEDGYLDIAGVTWDESERGKGPTGTAIRSGQVSIVRDTSNDASYEPWQSEATKRGYASSIALPLTSKGRSFGALNIYAAEAGSFDEDEVELLMRLAEDLAFGIETLRLRAEHSAVEEALVASEERYRTVFENTGTAMCTCYLDHTISAANNGFQKMTGFRDREVSGNKKIGDLVATDPAGIFEEYMEKAKSSPAKIPEQIRASVLNRHGKSIPALVSIGLMPSHNEFIVSLIDITIEQEYENILTENAAQLRDFLIVAAHELRHPITIIAGYSEILTNSLHQITPEKLDRINDSVHLSMRRLEHILNDLLDIAHIEKGLTVFKEDVDVRRAVRETAREFVHRGCERPLLEVETGLTAKADIESYKRVLTILVDNAIKFSPPGAPVEIQADAYQGKARVSVLDRGPGVPESARERIFERFYQQDADHHTAGLGIGLYIAREIAKAHGGDIWYEPREGGGSIFRFAV